MVTSRRAICLMFLLMLSAACPGREPANDAKMLETRISGQAFFNHGGQARIHAVGPDGHLERELAQPAIIADDGNFVFNLRGLHGDMLITASGGGFVDPLTEQTTPSGDGALHAFLYDTPALQETTVAVNPWSELLYRRSIACPGHKEDSVARGILDEVFGGAATSEVTRAHAERPNWPLTHLGAEALAYVHNCTWLQLARSIGVELGVGERGVSVMRLTSAIGNMLAKKGQLGDSIEVIVGKPRVQSNLLRQRYAQAMRAYLASDKSITSANEQALSHLIKRISSASADIWGPQGEPVDLEAPAIELDEGIVLAGPGEITCVARDPSGVQKMAIEVLEGDVIYAIAPVLPHIKIEGENTNEARITATIDPSTLKEGDFVVTCRAIDRWGNANSRNATFGANKGVEVKTVAEPYESRDNQIFIKGQTQITCQCTDRYPEEKDACGLDDASSRLPGVRFKAPITGGSVYEWDTMSLPDGEQTITCQARSRGLTQPRKIPRKVRINNFSMMHVPGQVTLETPVRGMTVRAYDWRFGKKGRLLADPVEAKDGTFKLVITNEHQGPILIEASPSQEEGAERGLFKNLATGMDVSLKHEHRLALVLADYTPAKQLPPLVINAATTIAADYAEALSKNETPTDAVAKAGLFMSQHIQPDGTLDLITTPVGDMSADHAGYQNSVLMGLLHVGMSRLVAEQGEGIDRFSTLDLLAAIKSDLDGDGILDGKNAQGDRVAMGQYTLSSETLRLDLAHATRRWLENADLHGQPSTFSKLNSQQFTRPRQYLRWITASNAMVFGGEDAQEFDNFPPKLTVRIHSERRDWSKDPENEIMRGVIEIRVDAVDETSVQNVTVKIEGSEHQPQCVRLVGIGTLGAFGEWTWNSRDAADGQVTLVVTATDGPGNVTTPPESIDITIDNTAPQVKIPQTLKVRDGNVILNGIVDKPYAALWVERDGQKIANLEVAPDEDLEGEQTFSVPLAVACDAKHVLAIFAQDDAGNHGPKSNVEVLCDTQAPALSWVTKKHKQAFSGDQVNVSNGVTFETYVHTLGSDSEFLPEISWYVDDQSNASIGSNPEDVKVEYAFEFVSNGRSRKSDWQAISPYQDKRFPTMWGYTVELSYESMLPIDIQNLDAYSLKNANYLAKSKRSDMHRLWVRATDEFKNTSVFDFEFHLDIRSTPVRVTCERQSYGPLAKTNTLSPQQAAHLLDVGHTNTHATVRWDIPENETEAGLAPSIKDAVLSVRMPNLRQSTVVYKTTEQLTVLKRITPAVHNNAGAWCEDRGMNWARIWSDNECEPHYGDSVSNSRKTNRSANFSQSFEPQERTMMLRGDGAAAVSYSTQNPTPMVLEQTADGQQRLQYRYRTAIEYERHVSWPSSPDRAWLNERLFVDNALITLSMPAPVVTIEGYPEPAAVIVDATCNRSWMLRDRS